ncbi:MAG: hypothetical protein NTU60_10990 [Candidatus Aminicenantes bacterium]|nr:hypothetical protein [Candidatus Aminicenantes bacterium]
MSAPADPAGLQFVDDLDPVFGRGIEESQPFFLVLDFRRGEGRGVDLFLVDLDGKALVREPDRVARSSVDERNQVPAVEFRAEKLIGQPELFRRAGRGAARERREQGCPK